jgi:hypothetical protein
LSLSQAAVWGASNLGSHSSSSSSTPWSGSGASWSSAESIWGSAPPQPAQPPARKAAGGKSGINQQQGSTEFPALGSQNKGQNKAKQAAAQANKAQQQSKPKKEEVSYTFCFLLYLVFRSYQSVVILQV